MEKLFSKSTVELQKCLGIGKPFLIRAKKMTVFRVRTRGKHVVITNLLFGLWSARMEEM